MSSPAVFSDWTISAYLIAARRCRPVVTLIRRTALHGWRSTAKTCWRSRSILTEHDPMYEEIASQVPRAFPLDRLRHGSDGRRTTIEMWDTEEGFFYDLLHLPNGDAMRLKVRSMVGLLPLCASTVLEATGVLARHPRLMELIEVFKKRHPDVLKHIAPADGKFVGYAAVACYRSATRQKIERILGYMLDENEFLGPYGIRSLSR